MLVCSIFNWILNMVFDVVVLKMYCVYSTFHAESREKSIQIAKKFNLLINTFYVLYLGFGINKIIIFFVLNSNVFMFFANLK